LFVLVFGFGGHVVVYSYRDSKLIQIWRVLRMMITSNIRDTCITSGELRLWCSSLICSHLSWHENSSRILNLIPLFSLNLVTYCNADQCNAVTTSNEHVQPVSWWTAKTVSFYLRFALLVSWIVGSSSLSVLIRIFCS